MRSCRFVLTCVVSCARPAPVGLPEITTAQWTRARVELAGARAALPSQPYVERVRMVMKDPRTGREISARGALAVSPERAARMLLVGPGGVTALDVWVTPDRFRFVVPGIHYERRGGRSPEESKGLPIGLLRWWFLSPFAGRLLAADTSGATTSWLLRDGAATVRVTKADDRFVAARREGGHGERIEWAGKRGRYVDDAFGLTVDVEIEEVMTAPPEPEAFADPDLEAP